MLQLRNSNCIIGELEALAVYRSSSTFVQYPYERQRWQFMQNHTYAHFSTTELVFAHFWLAMYEEKATER